jgi:hypothetical protein
LWPLFRILLFPKIITLKLLKPINIPNILFIVL